MVAPGNSSEICPVQCIPFAKASHTANTDVICLERVFLPGGGLAGKDPIDMMYFKQTMLGLSITQWIHYK